MNNAWEALLNGGIQGVVLFAVIWLLLSVTPRRLCSASTRYVIWWIALACVLALPAFQARAPRLPKPASLTAAAPRRPAPAAATGLLIPQLRTLTSSMLRIPQGPWQRWLLLLWAASSGWLLLRLIRGYAAMHRICASAGDAPVDAVSWLAPLGLSADSVRVGFSASLPTPVAAGVRRPVILIPTGLIDFFDSAELRHAGLHEAAHIVRRDPLAILLQRIVEALLWLHPAVRLIARRIDLEREIACDDLVVEATANPRGYAQCLTRMVELCGKARPSAAFAGFAEYRPHLSQRVELIMKQTRGSLSHSRAVLATFGAALCGLSIFLAGRPAMVAMAAPQTAPASTPNPSARLLAFFFETTTMTPEDLSRAVDTAIRLVDTRITDGQEVAIIVSNGQAQVRSDFTADRAALRRTIRGIGLTPATNASNSSSRIFELRRTVATLSPLPGRKALVYFSASTPLTPADVDKPTLQAAIDDAQRANVAIYVIDTRGVR